MKRHYYITALMVFVAVLLFATPAFAFDFGKVVSWVDGNAVAFLVTGVLAIGAVGAFVARYTGILAAVGWLLITVDNAASDRKITREELGEMKAKWNAVRDAVKAAKNG